MSGKAYTMKEMKNIVEYLIEHRAFAEIKGRKMWMDYANSKLTNRTWQSLKETFLKRILPDIHNPYYKLSIDHIRSFREGIDILDSAKNKLEIFEIEDDSNSNAEKETENEKPSTSHDNNQEATSGEDVTCAKIQLHDRASVDTVIIANCYETDDDLRRVLESESPKSSTNGNPNRSTPTKSLRDLITYSEPLTPMLQEVLNDFASEEESEGEFRMQIVENEEPNSVNANEEPVIEIFDSEVLIDKNKTGENILKKDKNTEDNLKQDKTAEDDLKNGKSSKDNLEKNKDAEDSSKTDNAMEDSLNRDKATENHINKDKTNEQIFEKNKDADVIVEKEKSKDDISENNKARETIEEKNISKGDIKKNKPIEDSLVKAKEKSVENQYDILDTEEFVEPKVLSLKLRKRKTISEKVQDKKSLEKNVKNRSEMYEIFKPEILEKSSSYVPEVDTLSNYVKNKDDIVSSTVSDKPTQTSSNSDTILPNNQEALNNSGKRTSTEGQIQNDISKTPNTTKKNVKPKTRKRANSQEVASTSNVKKNKLLVNTNGKEKAVSDTDDIVKKKLIKSKPTKSKLEIKKKNAIDDQANDIPNKPNGKDNTNDTKPEEVPSTSRPFIDSSQASELNPCLKSVSLFAEQFNTVSYLDLESEHETTPAASTTDPNNVEPSTSKTNENENESIPDKYNEKIATARKNKDKKFKKIKTIAMDVDEVVMLKSHSESESGTNKEKDKSPVSQEKAKAKRDKALANVFGFYSGGLKRKKRLSYRKNAELKKYQRHDVSSDDSSEWTSESDSEAYVSPPRGRKNKHARKYLKPQSARILSLEDEGGLFVMYGKKIYPLVKDGKVVKNYLTYLPESDPEEEESYWKLKYMEERKRVAEMKKLMKEKEEIVREKSPILPARALRLSSTSRHHESSFKNAPNNDSSKELVVAPEKETKEVEKDTGKTLKITFAKNNQEVHMEGHWSHIHPVLAEVVQIFNKESDAPANKPAKVETERPSDATSVQIISVPSSVDREIQAKVNKLETEIFKEIEDRDQEENTEQPKEQPESNVTKRKRASRVRKSASTQRSSVSSPSSTRSPKRQKTSTDEPKDELEKQERAPRTRNKRDSKAESKEVKLAEVVKETVEAVDSTTTIASKKSARTPKKQAKDVENQSTSEINIRSTRRSKPPVVETQAANESSQVEDDPDIRYMLPPATRSRTSTLNISKSKDKSKRYMVIPPKIFSSPHLSMHDESTQGYQDSDVSPPKNLRRKRKLSLSTVLYRNKNKNHRVKRKSFPCITDEGSSDSNSGFQIIVRPSSNSSLKSEVYKSDSYQLIFPQNKNSFRPLEKIDEHSPMPNDNLHPNQFASLDSHGRTLKICVNKINTDFLPSFSNGNTDGGNSSNVSLPVSPELSIVENLSISKELVNSVEDYPTLNEMQANNTANKVTPNKYLISQVDVSMPLMQQDCGLHKSISKTIKTESNSDHIKRSFVSESLLNKIDKVNIEDAPSLSESLDTRLRNLLLESAKKMSMTSVQEVQNSKLVSKNEVNKKGKSNKRCSTPRKKKDLLKPKLPIVDPVVEEEFTESCSFGGRKSCPPVIQDVISTDAIYKENIKTDKDTVTEKTKARRKKDVIKVKILRPRNKSLQSRSPEITRNNSRNTMQTDSGINESGLTVQGLNDSIDLIHNHSETCLHANECMGNSVEFIETNTKSIISLNTDSATSPDRISREQFIFQDCQDLVPDLYCQNAQSFCHVDYVPESMKLIKDNTSDTVYHSPVVSEVSMNSLITEDLSDETPQSSQPTKWYLLSEDDTSTTNMASRNTSNSVPSGFGANLKQIFPITCSVPDLSTITEKSNENSRKSTIDSANTTRHDLDSQSMFDMNSN